MNLPEFCIRRPIAAVMFNLALAVIGVVGLSRLPVRELPDIDPRSLRHNDLPWRQCRAGRSRCD